jgi:hypothetical protein
VYAQGVLDGVRFHTTPDPFGRHAFYRWREESVDRLSPEAIPAGPDSRYWFFSYPCEDYDFLYDPGWTTYPGRMAAHCPHRHLSFRQSRHELPPDLPERTMAWVAGYLAGSAPAPPDVAADDQSVRQTEVVQRWNALAEQFRQTGWFSRRRGRRVLRGPVPSASSAAAVRPGRLVARIRPPTAQKTCPAKVVTRRSILFAMGGWERSLNQNDGTPP